MKKILCIIVVILLFIGIPSTIFALVYATNSNIISNVTIDNIDVSSLSKKEAEDKLNDIVNDILEDKITLKHGEHTTDISLSQMEVSISVSDTVYEACLIGRSEGIFKNNYTIIETMLNGKNLTLEITFNDEILSDIFSGLNEEWEDNFIDNSYYIDGEKLIIVKGTAGEIVDEESLKSEIIDVIHQKIQGESIDEIEIPTTTKEPEKINLQTIKDEIYKEPQNASYDETTKTVHTEVNGIDFAITVEEAESLLQEDKEEYTIPLKIIKAEITTEDLGEEAFPDTLGTFSTRYDASNTNRANNIELAVKAINGKVILPGETFSFNAVVGTRTQAKGYLLATAYSSGSITESYGGGVCQVSTTIYNAAVYANLEIVERSSHSLKVSYVECGKDATVSYGVQDFVFKNSRDYAIKINATAKNGILTIEIKGILEDEEYDIEITSDVTQVIAYDTKYVYDETLEEGEEVVETNGVNGAKSVTYKIKKKNGSIISKEVLSNDSYASVTKVIRTGTKNS